MMDSLFNQEQVFAIYAEGQRKEGIREGSIKEKINNAVNLNKNGVPIKIIAKSLNVTEDVVKNWIQKYSR